jgi:hypothetical protein
VMMMFVMNISTYGRNREMEEDTWCDGEPYKDDGNMVIAEMIMLLGSMTMIPTIMLLVITTMKIGYIIMSLVCADW